MGLAEAVATAYHVPLAQAERIPVPLLAIFHRNAVRRGWLTPEETP
ncbi:MAG: hypothetical protein Q8M17_10690 [Actinomycetota bacterium]|nr:hypothetical protein [Actinomycetota bacterium]